MLFFFWQLEASLRGSNQGRRLDAVCGEDRRLMYAVVCNDDSSSLYCGPNKEKDFYCTDPHDKWLEAKCKKNGGFKEIDESASGCYPTSPAFWADVVGLANGDDFCGEKLPTETMKEALENAVANSGISSNNNLGFEEGSFNEWTASSGSDGYTEVVYSPSLAKEGNYFARLSGTQSLSRSIDLQDVSPKPDTCGDLGLTVCMSYWYKFTGRDSCYWNDYMTTSFEVAPSGPTLFYDYKDHYDVAGDDDCTGSTGWLKAQISVTNIPAGFVMKGTINNLYDTAADSLADFDGFEISSGECTI